MNSGKTLFAQVMDFVPWTSFARIVDRHDGNARVRSLTAADHFRAMAFAQMTWRQSLRDIEACLNANSNKLYAMGFRSRIRRSTLADANESRSWKIWADLSKNLIKRARRLYATDPNGLDLENTVYALDSSTIDLCLSLFPWAEALNYKGGVKVHTLLDLHGSIPALVLVTIGRIHDVNTLDQIRIEPGAFYVLDRGYLDFARLYRIHQTGAFFVIRSKSNFDSRRLYSVSVDRTTGVICDQRITPNGQATRKRYPELLRRVRYKDATTGKKLDFLTNNTALPATTICALYKQRWQVELFFKWIKQNLCIRHFLGNSENAVKTQIWCAVATYVLIAIIKKELRLTLPLYTCLQILSVSSFEKTQLESALSGFDYKKLCHSDFNQLKLFDF